MAFITAPILAIYNVAPISLFINAGVIQPRLPLLPGGGHPLAILFPITFISINALIIWFLNIWLLSVTKWLRPSWRYILSFAFIVVWVTVIFSLTASIRPMASEMGSLRYYPLIGTVANNAFILIMIDLVLNQGKRAELELEKANLEAINLKSRHEQLKQQIQPHFLFNALHTLKLLIKRDVSAADDYVLRLSSFLRASVSGGMEEKVTVHEDLQVFEDFMSLQKVRFPKAILYHYDLPNQWAYEAYLPVFTFQILAENAIKHNGFNQENPLRIEICSIDGMITFSNNLIPMNREVSSMGIGLQNLSERFRITSGEEIKVVQDTDRFTVTFKTIHA